MTLESGGLEAPFEDPFGCDFLLLARFLDLSFFASACWSIFFTMGIVDIISLAMFHPQELRAMVTYKVWRDPLNDIKSNPEESGWNRESMQACWGYLDLTSRSFAAVIKELRGEMSRFICIFYLALRALDTIEDDMTLDPARKIELLTNFYHKLEEPGWNFTDSELNLFA